jgi:hypothetical protein
LSVRGGGRRRIRPAVRRARARGASRAKGTATKASAHLRFESVDEKKNLARWKGPVHVEESVAKSAEQI